MKKITSNIACFLSGVIIASTVGAIAATYTATENTYPIKVNGQSAQMEGYNIGGSTYFKLRDIGSKMGFDVGFNNNTIYVGEVPSEVSNIEYYPEPYSWCPDFGKYTGTTLYKTVSAEYLGDAGHIYIADMDDLEEYAYLLAEMGYRIGTRIGDDTKWLSFVNDDDCLIQLSYENGFVSVLMARGWWMTEKFVPYDNE